MKRYTILEEEAGIPALPNPITRALLNHEKIVGKAVKNGLFYRKGDRFKWCYELGEFTEVGERVLDLVLSDESFAKDISRNVREKSRELHEFSEKIVGLNLQEKSNPELADLFTAYAAVLEEAVTWGALIEVMEVYNSLFSNFVTKKLEELISAKNLKLNAKEVFAIMTIPEEESFAKQQEKEFLAILQKAAVDQETKQLFNGSIEEVKSRVSGTKLETAISEYVRKYSWVNYYYVGPAMTASDVIDLLKHALAAGIDSVAQLNEMECQAKGKKEKQKRILEELAPDEKTEKLLLTAKEFLTLKFVRKEAMFHGNFAADKIREVACERFGITMNQCRCLTFDEFAAALKSGRVDKNELTARGKEFAQLIDDGVEKVYSGSIARELSKRIIEVEVSEFGELKGTCASPGKVKGVVRLIAHVEDMVKMRQGDVLVANATNPNFVPAMRKAAAIVTDMGGITSHAAIVSREFGIPCVVGTRFATKALRDEDIVEVDATNGIVRKI